MEKVLKGMVVMFLCMGVLFSSLGYIGSPVQAAKPVVKNYGLHDTDEANRYGWMTDVKKMYESFASPAATVTNYNYFTKSTLLSGLKSANYLNIHTHGGDSDGTGNRLKCIDSSNNISYLKMSDISGLSSTAFSSMKVCYLGACYSALSGSNLALAVKNHGAKCTIGYSKSVKTAYNYNTIAAYNLYYTTTDSTVAGAMALAVKGTYNKYGGYGDVDSYKIYGTSSLKYN